MDPITRRSGLSARPNPDTRHDLLVELHRRADMAPDGGPVQPEVTLRYVPDRDLLDPDSLSTYLSGLGRWVWSGPEDLALAILEDINNELVPRWVQVGVALAEGPAAGHRVLVEDCQPRWTGQPPQPPTGRV